uniref:Uncharacterized protein n=1 Tax=Arundo donax TaxID=35708 RepID=A0A0A8YMV4_ARUDO
MKSNPLRSILQRLRLPNRRQRACPYISYRTCPTKRYHEFGVDLSMLFISNRTSIKGVFKN